MRKSLVFIMVLVLFAAMISGCSPKASQPQPAAPAAEATPVPEAAPTEETAPVVEAAPIAETASAGESTPENIEISWFQFQVEFAEQMGRLTKAYTEANPNVAIDCNVMGDNYPPSLMARAASNDMPDVFMTYGYTQAANYERFLRDISDEPFVERFVDSAMPAVTQDGKVVGIPTSIASQGIIYNKAIFAEHNLEIPTTLTELKAICETLKANDVMPFVNQFKDDWLLGIYLGTAFGYEGNGSEITADLMSGTTTFTKLPLVDLALDFMDLMIENGLEHPLNYGWNEVCSAFAQGRAAMMFEGEWMYDSLIAIDPDFEMGMFPTPMTDDVTLNLIEMDVNSVWHINANTAHADELVKVFDWVTSDPVAKDLLLNDFKIVPAFKGWEFTGDNVLSKDGVKYAENGTKGWAWLAWPDGFREAAGRRLQDYISGTLSRENAAQEFDVLWQRFMNN